MAKVNLITNGSGTETGDAKVSYGGDALFSFTGTFDSATCTIELSADGTNWDELHDASGVTISVTSSTQDVYVQNIKPEYSVRGIIAGGGGSTDINIDMIQ